MKIHEEQRIRQIIHEELEKFFSDKPYPISPIPFVPYDLYGCRVCGRGQDGKPDGYVCSRADCPSLITC